MSKPAIARAICVSLLREYLSGFHGYPKSPDSAKTSSGEDTFARILQDCALSVGHARAILETMDLAFPTKRDIEASAVSLRPKFEQQVPQTLEWERKYGKPAPFEIPNDFMAMHWQAIRDSLYYTEGPGVEELRKDLGSKEAVKALDHWRGAAARDKDRHPDAVQQLRRQIASYGWKALLELSMSPEPFVYAVDSPAPAKARPAAPLITQADIDHAIEQRKAQAATAELAPADSEEWDDPNR